MSGSAADTPATLAVECLGFARHIAGAHATPYQIEKYLAVHQAHALAPRDAFDTLLLGVARRGGFCVSLADAYCGFFARRSVVRSKLIAVLAILECSPPSFRALDAPDPGGRFVIVSMALRGAAAAATLICALLILTPARLALGAKSSG